MKRYVEHMKSCVIIFHLLAITYKSKFIRGRKNHNEIPPPQFQANS